MQVGGAALGVFWEVQCYLLQSQYFSLKFITCLVYYPEICQYGILRGGGKHCKMCVWQSTHLHAQCPASSVLDW